MLKAMVAKKGLDFIINKVVKAREIKKLRKYVEEKNELDIQMEQLQKTVAKQGKQLEIHSGRSFCLRRILCLRLRRKILVGGIL